MLVRVTAAKTLHFNTSLDLKSSISFRHEEFKENGFEIFIIQLNLRLYEPALSDILRSVVVSSPSL